MSTRICRPPAARARAAGFSLVEVMVAVIVLCVGLLGIAKMQALALASTSSAGQRGLAAIQAASLAASMHENRAFWTTTASGLGVITVTGNIVNNPPVAPPVCTFGANAPCTSIQLAAYDLQQWATALGGGGGQPALLPNPSARIQCNPVTPVNCTIQITWSEKAIALNNTAAAVQTANTAAGNTAAIQLPTYTLFVQP